MLALSIAILSSTYRSLITTNKSTTSSPRPARPDSYVKLIILYSIPIYTTTKIPGKSTPVPKAPVAII